MEYKCNICGKELKLIEGTDRLKCTGNHGYWISLEMYKAMKDFFNKQDIKFWKSLNNG